MPSLSVYKGYELPTVAGDAGTWGSGVTGLNFSLSQVDLNVGAYAAQALTNAPVTLSATQAASALLRLTGALSGAVAITTSNNGFQFIENLTTNAFAVTITNGFGSPLTIPQGSVTPVIMDGTNGCRMGVILTLSQLTTILGSTYPLSSNAQVNAAILAKTSQAVTTSGASLTINCALGMEVDLAVANSVTSVSVSNWPTTGALGVLTLHCTSSGNFNLSGFPGTTRWPYGVAPTLTNGGRDSIVLQSSDGGSTFRGFIAGQQIA